MFVMVYNNWWFNSPDLNFYQNSHKRRALIRRQVYRKSDVIYCRYCYDEKPLHIIRALEGNFRTFCIPYDHPFPLLSREQCIVAPVIAEILPVCLFFTEVL